MTSTTVPMRTSAGCRGAPDTGMTRAGSRPCAVSGDAPLPSSTAPSAAPTANSLRVRRERVAASATAELKHDARVALCVVFKGMHGTCASARTVARGDTRELLGSAPFSRCSSRLRTVRTQSGQPAYPYSGIGVLKPNSTRYCYSPLPNRARHVLTIPPKPLRKSSRAAGHAQQYRRRACAVA